MEPVLRNRTAQAARIPAVAGGELSWAASAAVMAMGVSALLMSGVLPVLLGAMVDLHRLTAPQLGEAAMAEGVVMGVSTGAASALLPATALRLWAVVSALALSGLSGACIWASGGEIILLRGLAGLPEGILLWITIGMIARHATPERLSAVLLAAMTATQFLLAVLLTVVVLPRFGAAGGFAALALATSAAVLIAGRLPKRYAPLSKPEDEGTAPPARGWVALLATVVFTASFAAVAVYLQPIAHAAGHDAQVARLSLTVSLLAQLIGGGVASAIAGRVHYLPVLAGGSLVYLGCWAVMGSHGPSWEFIAANALAGFCYLAITPFLVPMTIEADPSRRAAMMSGGAQVLAGAVGPLAASQLISPGNVHPALWLAASLMVSGLALIAGLHLDGRRRRSIRPLAVVS